MGRRPGNEWLYVLGTVCLAMAFSYFNYQGIQLSDQYLYAKNAYAIANASFGLSPSVFSNRFGLLLPMALSVKVWGAHYFAFFLWPYCVFIALMLSTYVFVKKYNRPLAFYTLVLMAFSPLLIKLSSEVLPDLVMATFVTIAVYILYAVNQKAAFSPLLMAFGFVACTFVSFTTKETVVFVLPFFAAVFIYDIYYRKAILFWKYSIGIGLVFALLYFYAYYYFTGDAWYRFTGIEREHNVSEVWGYYQRSGWEVLARLTYRPLLFMVSSHYYSYLFIISVIFLSMWKVDWGRPFSFLTFWALYFTYLLFVHWFGSTSFQSLNPLPLEWRMWILLVPAMCILSAHFAWSVQKGAFAQKNSRPALLASLFFLVFAISAYLATKEIRLVFAIYFSLLLSGYFFLPQFEVKRWFLVAAFLCPLIAYQLWYARLSQEKPYFEDERKVLAQLNESPGGRVVVLADKLLSERYDVYFNFAPNAGIVVLDWADLDFSLLCAGQQIYVLVNQERINTLGQTYRYQLPGFISAIKDNNDPYFSQGNIAVYRLSGQIL